MQSDRAGRARRSEEGLYGGTTHEIRHNWLPMVVNSDERRHAWMDEGFNTFLQGLAHREWEEGWPGNIGSPESIVPFMISKHQMPVMNMLDRRTRSGKQVRTSPQTVIDPH